MKDSKRIIENFSYYNNKYQDISSQKKKLHWKPIHLPLPAAVSDGDAWGIEALSVSHKATTLARLSLRRSLWGGGFVDAVPKARPEYSEGHAPKSSYISCIKYSLSISFKELCLWAVGVSELHMLDTCCIYRCYCCVTFCNAWCVLGSIVFRN